MLHVVSKQEAVHCVCAFAENRPPRTDTVALSGACGRVLAADVIAQEDVPAFDRSTMDGFAVCAADTFGASAAGPSQL